MVEEEDLPRIEALELTAELGTDAAARAGNEYTLADDVAGHPVEVAINGLAAEQVVYGHLPDVADADLAATGHKFERCRQDGDRQLEALGLLGKASHEFGVGGGN